jgi:hypothetical protein
MPPVADPAAPSVNQVLEAASASTRPVAEALYKLLLRAHPQASILAWPKQRIVSFGFGPKKMTQHYAYIGIQSAHVNLGFYMGAFLEDPSAMLEGTGKNLRHVKLHTAQETKAADLWALIQGAIRERRPHAATAA